MRIAAETSAGLIRQGNEDSFWFDRRLQAMALADGMGGHQGGEIASLLAAQSFAMLCELLLSREDPPAALPELMPKIIPAIDRLVTLAGSKSANLLGMGTTLVGAVCRDGRLHLVHLGDSRAAFVSLADRKLTWLTRDDNYAEFLVGRGELTAEEARRSPYRHRLTGCIGGGFHRAANPVAGHYQCLDWPDNQLLLLCSDGLLDGSDDMEIAAAAVPSNPEALATSCQRLIDLAIGKGGRDNSTVVLADRR